MLSEKGEEKGKLLFALGELHGEVLKALEMQEKTRQQAIKKANEEDARRAKEEEKARKAKEEEDARRAIEEEKARKAKEEEEERKMAEKEAKENSLEDNGKVVSGELRVKLVQAEKLPCEFFDKADAYVKIQLNDEKQMSKVVNDSADPLFNEEFVFQLKEQPTKQKLRFQIFDKDIGTDDFICGALKGIQKVLETPETWFWTEEPLSLFDNKDKRIKAAKLNVHVIFQADKVKTVPFNLIKGENLAPSETLDQMQSLVKVKVNGEKVFDTKSISKDTDPFWNHVSDVQL